MPKERPLLTVPTDVLRNLRYRKHLLNAAVGDERLQQEIFSRCARDPVFFFNVALWTYSPKDYPAVPHRPFILWPYQERGLKTVLKFLGKKDLLGEKTRDMGFTWFVLATFLHQWMFVPSQTFLLGSRKEELVDKAGDTKTLFWKLDYMLKHLPPWMLPNFTRQKLHLGNNINDSVIDGESTNEDFARGDRRVAIFMDEAAAMPNGHQVLSAAQYATSCCILGSTHKGNAGMFIEQRDLIKADEPERILRWHWTEHPLKNVGMYIGQDGRARSIWYDIQCKRTPSRKQIAEEIDIEPAAAGGQFFDPDVLNKLLDEMPLQPSFVGELRFTSTELNPTWMNLSGGRLEVWCPLSGEGTPPLGKYVLGVDVSAGTASSESSNSVAVVYEAMTGEKVAQFVSNAIYPERFADYCVALSKWFHGAYLAWDGAGPGKQFAKQVVREIGYTYVFYRTDDDSVSSKKTRKPGWYHQGRSRRDLLGHYQEALVSGKLQNRSRKALLECSEFIYDGDDVVHVKAKHAQEESIKGQNHGDCVISDAIAWRAMQDVRPKETKTELAGRERRPIGPPPRGSLAERMEIHKTNGAKRSKFL
jgi:hypothetical protein